LPRVDHQEKREQAAKTTTTLACTRGVIDGGWLDEIHHSSPDPDLLLDNQSISKATSKQKQNNTSLCLAPKYWAEYSHQSSIQHRSRKPTFPLPKRTPGAKFVVAIEALPPAICRPFPLGASDVGSH
jgi:hypothetical protein